MSDKELKKEALEVIKEYLEEYYVEEASPKLLDAIEKKYLDDFMNQRLNTDELINKVEDEFKEFNKKNLMKTIIHSHLKGRYGEEVSDKFLDVIEEKYLDNHLYQSLDTDELFTRIEKEFENFNKKDKSFLTFFKKKKSRLKR